MSTQTNMNDAAMFNANFKEQLNLIQTNLATMSNLPKLNDPKYQKRINIIYNNTNALNSLIVDSFQCAVKYINENVKQTITDELTRFKNEVKNDIDEIMYESTVNIDEKINDLSNSIIDVKNNVDDVKSNSQILRNLTVEQLAGIILTRYGDRYMNKKVTQKLIRELCGDIKNILNGE